MSSLQNVLHPVIFLRNIKTIHMKPILNFLYTGVANVTEDDVDQFMKIANELKIEGLMINNKRGRKRRSKAGVKDESDVEDDKEDEALLQRLREKYCVKPVCLDLTSDPVDTNSVTSSPPPSPTPLLSRQNAIKKPRKQKLSKATSLKTFSTTDASSFKSTHSSAASCVSEGSNGVTDNVVEENESAADYCPMCNARVGAGGLTSHMEATNVTECHVCNMNFDTCGSLYDHKRGNCGNQ